MAHPYDSREHRELERYAEARGWPGYPPEEAGSAKGEAVSTEFADALRAEGAAAEREKIRLAAISEAERHERMAARGFGPFAHKALRDFAATLEKP